TAKVTDPPFVDAMRFIARWGQYQVQVADPLAQEYLSWRSSRGRHARPPPPLAIPAAGGKAGIIEHPGEHRIGHRIGAELGRRLGGPHHVGQVHASSIGTATTCHTLPRAQADLAVQVTRPSEGHA